MRHKKDCSPCPECGSTERIFDSETGEEVCKKCGLVLSVHYII
jgi:transcription initiation factor TFIIIB Brf1 subunit/transcription initiation factor TFIIB